MDLIDSLAVRNLRFLNFVKNNPTLFEISCKITFSKTKLQYENIINKNLYFYFYFPGGLFTRRFEEKPNSKKSLFRNFVFEEDRFCVSS
jgi:hypothetical protein